jgi:4-oxalocrotonate tautomerase
MPIIQVEMKSGRSEAQKHELTRKLTDAVVEALEVKPEQVRILLREYAPGHYTIGSEIVPTTPEPTDF